MTNKSTAAWGRSKVGDLLMSSVSLFWDTGKKRQDCKNHRDSLLHPCPGQETETQKKEEAYLSSENKFVPEAKPERISLHSAFIACPLVKLASGFSSHTDTGNQRSC